MSSMRNAVQRRNHKERAQPLARSKWGLLEKHKDYALRAADHNSKKKRLRALRQKAADRNPDEFAFGMMSSTTKKGVKVQARGADNGGAGSLDVSAVGLLKRQDAGYLRTVLQQTKREREKAWEEMVRSEKGVVVGEQAGEVDLGRRKRFDEDGNEIAVLTTLRKGSEDGESGDGNAALDKEEIKTKRKRTRHAEVLQRRVEALREREEQLTTALEEVEQQRARMNGNIGSANKSGVKFRPRERKR